MDSFTVGDDVGRREDKAGADEGGGEEEEEEKEEEEEEDDDYMNMVIAEPTKPREKETYTQRRLRKEREVRCTPEYSSPRCVHQSSNMDRQSLSVHDPRRNWNN